MGGARATPTPGAGGRTRPAGRGPRGALRRHRRRRPAPRPQGVLARRALTQPAAPAQRDPGHAPATRRLAALGKRRRNDAVARSGSSIRGAHPGQVPGLHRGGGPFSGARHRAEHGDLLAGARRALPGVGRGRAGDADRRLHAHRRRPALLQLVPELRDHRGGRDRRLRAGNQSQHADRPPRGCFGRDGDGARGDGLRIVLRGDGCLGRSRSRPRPGRRPGGRGSPGRGARAPLLEEPVRGGPRRRRLRDPDERSAVHGRRRGARQLQGSTGAGDRDRLLGPAPDAPAPGSLQAQPRGLHHLRAGAGRSAAGPGSPRSRRSRRGSTRSGRPRTRTAEAASGWPGSSSPRFGCTRTSTACSPPWPRCSSWRSASSFSWRA